MNADHKFAALGWNYASVQDTAGHSELKSTDGDFPTFEINQNKPIDVGPSTSRALILQEPVIYFDQSAEDPAKYSIIAKFFSLDQIHAVSVWKSVKFAAKMTIQPKVEFLAVRFLFYIPHHICCLFHNVRCSVEIY